MEAKVTIEAEVEAALLSTIAATTSVKVIAVLMKEVSLQYRNRFFFILTNITLFF